MPNLPKMASMTTRDITVDVLLERIQNNFRRLKSGSVDESELKQDLQDLVEGVKEVGQELMTEYQWLKELLEDVRTEERKALFLTQLQTDHEELLRTRTRIQELKSLVEGTENLVEVVYKITAARSLLGRLRNPAAQRSMSQSLSKISVAQERVFDGRKGLVELIGELERRGLEAKLLDGDGDSQERMKAAQLAARSAVERLTKTGGEPARASSDRTAGQTATKAAFQSVFEAATATGQSAVKDRTPAPATAKTPPAAIAKTPPAATAPSTRDKPPENGVSARGSATASRVTEADRRATKSRIRPVRGGSRSNDTRSVQQPKTDLSGLSRADAERAKRALNDWARWKALAPVNLGDVVRLVDAKPEEATLIRVRSLVGERKWRGEVSRTDASREQKKGESLWDLPATPPAEFTSATEESDYCETTYRPRHLEHLVYAGDVPPDVLRDVSGKVLLQEDLSACRNGVVEASLEDRCLQALSKWTSRNDDLSEHFKPVSAGNGGAAKEAPASRLVKSSLTVESIPVLHLQCELGLGRGRHYLLDAWLCGDEKRMHLGDVPKTWTWKTTAWLAVIATLGIPVGFLLAGLVQA